MQAIERKSLPSREVLDKDTESGEALNVVAPSQRDINDMAPPDPQSLSSHRPDPQYLSSHRPETIEIDTVNKNRSPVKGDNKILYVTDTVGDNISLEALKNATNRTVIKSKILCGSKSSNAYKKVLVEKLSEENIDSVLIQTPAEDISNLDIHNEPDKNIDILEQEVKLAANEIFKVAEDILMSSKNVKKVVLLKHIHRYDPPRTDPYKLKREISVLFSNTLDECLNKSIFKDKIILGQHNLGCDGPQRDARYMQSRTGKFDGVHLLGPSGPKMLTLSVLNIMKNAGMTSNEYKRQLERASIDHQRNPRRPFRNPAMISKHTTSQNISARICNDIPTYNRFDVLNRISGNC